MLNPANKYNPTFDLVDLRDYADVDRDLSFDTSRLLIWETHNHEDVLQRMWLDAYYDLWCDTLTFDLYVPEYLTEFHKALERYCTWRYSQENPTHTTDNVYFEGLNDVQKQVLEQLLTFTLDGSSHIFLFEGYPGVGKSYTVARYLKWLRDNNKRSTILAPTHKAKSVLDTFCNEQSLHIEASTLASMLCMKPIYEQGKQKFVHKPSSKGDYEKLDTLGISVNNVDESSMLNERYLELLQNYCHKIVFIGDRYQLPPVESNSTSSPVFSLPFESQYNFVLDKVVRNKGNILAVCNYIRNNIGTGYLNLQQFANDADVVFATYDQALEFKSTYKDARFITYTNNRADEHCHIVRKQLGLTAEYSIGEIVYVTKAPITLERLTEHGRIKDTVANIQDEILITDVKVARDTLNMFYFELTGQNLVSGNVIRFNVLSARSTYKYGQHLNELRAESQRTRSWGTYIDAKETYSSVRHTHAITADSSQGSTYEYVIVDTADILKCKVPVERNKRLYVACSRAKSVLMFI